LFASALLGVKLSALVRALPSEATMACLAPASAVSAAVMSAGTGGVAARAALSRFSALVTSSSTASTVGNGLGGQAPLQRTRFDPAATTLSTRRGPSLTERLRKTSRPTSTPAGSSSTTVRLKRSALAKPMRAATSADTSRSVAARRFIPQAPRWAASHCSRLGAVQAHDDRLAAAIQVEVSDRVAEAAFHPDTAKGALEIRKAVDRHRLIVRPAQRASQESGDRGGNARDGANAAGDLLDVDSRITDSNRHGLSSSVGYWS
jgi:hypothetical protein